MQVSANRRGADRFRVLASAYACEPGLGSEPGIGWNWARQIALHHELTLITRRNNVEAIRRQAASEDLRMEVIGHDLSDAAMRWKGGARRAMPYYYLWQRSLGKLVWTLDPGTRFDVVHHLTFASGWIPSGLAGAGLPFVFGPVGQHPRIPTGFQESRRWSGPVKESLRESVRRLLPKLDPDVLRTWHAADVILSLGSTFGDRLPGEDRQRVRPMLACGIDVDHLSEPVARGANEPMRVLFCGRLVELKGVHLALRAFRMAARETDMVMEIIGDGPERARLEALIQREGLQDRVQLRGHLPHAEAIESMRNAHVFLFPSFEGAGMVIPEAMAAGATVLCLDFGGPGEMCAHGRGVTVPLEHTYPETASELATHLRLLERDDRTRLRVAEVGQEWARRNATWSAKGEALRGIYQAAVLHHQSRSQTGSPSASPAGHQPRHQDSETEAA